jgi:2',3'-cyclic-nucleotide 2'-phosphodiesterase/3'-nucleotidase
MRHCLRYSIFVSLIPAALSLPAGAAPRVAAGSTATLAVLETTDLHSNVVGYDYFKLSPEPSIGLDRTATLIAQARSEFPNTLLLDNGDTIQGNALGDYQALAHPLACGETLGIYKAMKRLGYEGGGVGNHDFNYGLAYLGQVTGSRFDVAGVDSKKRCAGPGFPIVLANVYSIKTHKPLFAPYHIINKRIHALDVHGKPVEATVKVGIIGFTPPTILAWDKRWLEGKVYTEGMVEAAKKYIPEMRAKGAELVVAISHGGMDGADYSPMMENAGYYLARVPGIDAMLLGHAHQVFPDAASKAAQYKLPGVDKAGGTVFGVPTVMASLWGKHLGVIGLHLRHDGKRWMVDKDQTTVAIRSSQLPDKRFVDADPRIMEAIEKEHAGTIEYVKTPVGETDFRMSTYFADVGDTSAIEVVNQAQADYVARYIAANLPQYARLPVLSVSAPFKAGANGVADYTDVQPGKLALNNAADLYLYPNTLAAVKVTGAQLKAWLEKAANRFNTIDPAKTEPQELVNTSFASYNFDTITSKDISYEIDITQPPGQRVRKLMYRGVPVTDEQAFIVATNNYRASGGGGFPGLDGSGIVLAAPDTNREVLIAYIRQAKQLTRAENAAQRSWRFAQVKTAGQVVFHAPPGMLGLAKDAGLTQVAQERADDGLGRGMGFYSVDFSK